MIVNRILFFISVLTVLGFTTRDSSLKKASVVITPESSLVVQGKTNVSTFSCAFNTNKFKNPMQVFYELDGGNMVFSKTALILENNCFDCGGNAINKDFQKILKSNKHPQIILLLKEIIPAENKMNVQASITIEIGGVTKGYKIPIKIKNVDGLLISGDLDIRLSDYNLETPKKLFGLIAIDDTIEINFQLMVREK
ncbi:YceI family protein [Mariniflexile sp. AS56]|uniref:YceI family protein n=1 Tax=Mariniflexile sp. AS56 TaxID=3063957 RepID=UPI0026EDE523|nr:YceI family protein [Mariniflexile sp. AS56]MDO7171725.1 YceI family protein [Mariniflexile sp. AS56]